MKEVGFYDALDERKVQCHVCHHHCIIGPKQRGICGVRENQKGKLYALNYGKTIATQIDPIEKKPLYHYLENTRTYSLATVGCNLHCLWCQNWRISQSPKPNKEIIGQYISPEEHINQALKHGCDSISYTYTEPTIFFEYAFDIMTLAKEKGLKNIWVSNGYMSKQVFDAIVPLLDAINIDIKGFDDDIHKKYCGCLAGPIRENIRKFHQAGIHIELTTLIVPGMNDDVKDLERIAEFIEELDPHIPWHISRMYPAWKMSDSRPTPKDIMYQAKELAKKHHIKNCHLGNI